MDLGDRLRPSRHEAVKKPIRCAAGGHPVPRLIQFVMTQAHADVNANNVVYVVRSYTMTGILSIHRHLPFLLKFLLACLLFVLQGYLAVCHFRAVRLRRLLFRRFVVSAIMPSCCVATALFAPFQSARTTITPFCRAHFCHGGIHLSCS